MNTTNMHETAQHTPGPWGTLDLGTDSIEQRIVNRDGDVIAVVQRALGASQHQPEYDARLIAAAPELLEAAQNAANVLAALATGQLKTIDRDSNALATLRSAIAKATGKA